LNEKVLFAGYLEDFKNAPTVVFVGGAEQFFQLADLIDRR
jgi:hypothetical protein